MSKLNWPTVVLQFPGQASQQVGMAADIAARYPAAAAVFEQADRLMGQPFSRLIFEGPAEQLDETSNTQPALFVTGIAILRALESIAGPLTPLAVAGHSLGEFTALAAAGALPFEAGLALVRERGRLVREEGQKNPGIMVAMLGAEIAQARAICEQASAEIGQPVVIGNDNCPGQVVISGSTQAAERAMELAKGADIKKVVKLAVSVALHSPLMARMADAFSAVLDGMPFETPRVPILGNMTATPLRTVQEIRAELRQQLTGTVRWTESIRALRVMGATTFLELGPKDVLTGLLKRIDREAEGFALNSVDALAKLAEQADA